MAYSEQLVDRIDNIFQEKNVKADGKKFIVSFWMKKCVLV